MKALFILLFSTSCSFGNHLLAGITDSFDDFHKGRSTKGTMSMSNRECTMQSWLQGTVLMLVKRFTPAKNRALEMPKIKNKMWNFPLKTNTVIRVPHLNMIGGWIRRTASNLW